MLVTFIDKLSGLFDRRFLVAYWGPIFLSLGAAAVVLIIHLGRTELLGWWTATSAIEQLWLSAGVLLLITVLAYLLQALTAPIIRLFQGLNVPAWFARWAVAEQTRTRERLRADITQAPTDREQALHALHRNSGYRTRYFHFPRSTTLLRPTRLGNTLVASEEYPYLMYRLDSVLWLPRLTPLLPEMVRSQIDDALTPMIALLNLCVLFSICTLATSALLLVRDQRWWFFALVFLGGWTLARLCYNAAVNQAVSYGSTVRVAFDLYRHEILKQMHIPVPDNLTEEWLVWDGLNQWIYRYIRPGLAAADPTEPPPTSSILAAPFHYDTYQAPAAPQPDKPNKIEVTLHGTPTVIVQQQEHSHD